MSYNSYQNGTNNNNVNTESEIQFSKIFSRAFYHWPLYVIVTFFSLAGAWLYLRYSNPVYVSVAKIYIKDENKGSSGHSNALDAFALLGGSKLVENEMEIIRSPLILHDVILNNRFNIRYFEKGPLSEFEVYEKRAVEIKILSDTAEVGNYLFDITRKNNTDIEVEYEDEEEEEHHFTTRFNQPFTIGKDRFMFTYNAKNNKKNIAGFQVQVDSIAELAYLKATQLKTALVNNKASVFLMSYEDRIARRSADFLNAVARKYNDYTLEDKNRTALTSIKFIDTRLKSLGAELGAIEKDVEVFKTTRGITQIDQSSRLYLEQAKDADQRLGAANIQLSVYDQIEKYINNSSDETSLTPVIGNIDAALTGVINRYQGLLSERKRLSMSLQPGNPLLQNVEQQITDSKNTIQKYISGYRQNAVAERAGLQRTVNQIEGQIAKVPKYEREFIDLRRQQSVKESLYLFLLQKREETSVSYASNIVENKIISPAFIPRDPVKPQKAVVLIGFILAGFVVASLYILIKYLINTRVNSKNDIEKLIGIPVVAEIFKQDNEKGKKFFDSDPRSVLNEQVLNLRSNLMFLLNDVRGTPTVLFTSSISGEGKTFLSAHLGKSLTSNHKKVILIELDLRKPKLAKSLGLSNQSGLTNYILGVETLDQVIKKVPDAENLYIIPSGPIPPNPIELIEGEKMRELFGILKERYDYVMIDTAPFGLVSDAKSLASFVDCALFVVRFNYTPKAKLVEVGSGLENTSFKKMGLIFNGIVQGSSYGYHSYGYSNFGYGYGYFGDENKNKIGSFVQHIRQRLL